MATPILLPKGLDYPKLEKPIYKDFQNLPFVPNRPPKSSIKALKMVKTYIETGSLIKAVTHHYTVENYTESPEKLFKRFYQTSNNQNLIMYVMWIVARKLPHNIYFKVNGEDVVPCKQMEEYLFNVEFKEQALNTALWHGVTGTDIGTIKMRYPNLARREVTVAQQTKTGEPYPQTKTQKVRKVDEIPSRILNNPALVGNYDDLRTLSDEEFRLRMMDIHIKNIHLIALDDEEKAADRIKSSDIILKIIGAYQLYNEQRKPEAKHIHVYQNEKDMLDRLREIDQEMKAVLSSKEYTQLREAGVTLQPEKEPSVTYKPTASSENKTFAKEKDDRANDQYI